MTGWLPNDAPDAHRREHGPAPLDVCDRGRTPQQSHRVDKRSPCDGACELVHHGDRKPGAASRLEARKKDRD